MVLKAVKATIEVNSWVKKETNGLIRQLLPPKSIHSSTRLIFANALYFKGEWNRRFDVSKTKDYDFHLVNGSSVKVPFKTSKKKQFITAFDGFKVLNLPYMQGEDERQFSMYFFLPNAKDGLSTMVKKVTSGSYLQENELCDEEVEVGHFRIPKFNISFRLESTNMLKKLGVILPFTQGDFTKIVSSSLVGQQLFVSKIFHKSIIEVNEKGVKAAAATGLDEVLLCRRNRRLPTRLDFVADHPFLFLIKEDSTGTILFIGQVLNPLGHLSYYQ